MKDNHFEIKNIRAQFPALKNQYQGKPLVYFDGPGGVQVPQSVIDAMAQHLVEANCNIGGRYITSEKTKQLVNQARDSAAQLLGAQSDEVFFGANMTSLTWHLSRMIAKTWQAGDEIIVTELDHAANTSIWQQVAADNQVNVKIAKAIVPDCRLDLAQLQSLLSSKTKLIAVTMASNFSGSLVDVAQVAALAHAVGAQVYVDAVHFAPHGLIDVAALDCDFLVCSAYKFFGPHLGIAYGKKTALEKLPVYKIAPAPNVIPACFESGTLNYEGLAGFIAAVAYLASLSNVSSEQSAFRARLTKGLAALQAYEQQLGAYFWQRLEPLLQSKQCQLYGLAVENQQILRTPTFALYFHKHSAEKIAIALGQAGICVWHGLFYADLLGKATGLDQRGGVIRVGLTHYNNCEEIDRFFSVLQALI